MGVSGLVWSLTIAALVGLTVFDYFFHVRKSHRPTVREAAVWSASYLLVAMVFGAGLMVFGNAAMGVEFFACYLSNEALSVDNLFVFLVIIGSFRVPRVAQQKVLLFGTVIAMLARIAFVFLGAAFISIFSWAFYLLAVLLFVTASNVIKPAASDEPTADNALIRVAKRLLRTSEDYDGDRLFTVENGKKVMTPMLLVMVAIGGSDLLFAFDSIPALFGLTQDIYIIFAATGFSLLGLRQLYFLIDGLLDRLLYLHFGLAAILGFIGVKLLLQALNTNNVPFVNGGKPVGVGDVSTTASLTVIVVILAITTVASLLSERGRMQNAVAGARRHATEYLDLHYEVDPAERERIYARLLKEESQIQALPMKYRSQIHQEDELMELLRRAHDAHDAHTQN
ncbi:hypothetical protein MSP7336_04031 [Mycobacterium shimoidei]|uniref:Uncharacterized protein n=1 Tax=Mycobacterium shimoidei TaxID=29313 RepID=A0A375Z3K9_MYCSH|nr:TerC/Alx family metal homeostasis membrane protein [Mycobacterium shimoidei]SRX95758.1 hypothetical protein MSP7336_04031 [Mycobacterium shimoidei]